MRAYERMLNYVKVWTTSDSSSESVPSTSRQFDLAKLLVEEMKELGIEDAHVDDKCYVYGTLPATKGYEDKSKLGFIAHLDTSEDISGQNVKPQIIENYDGEDIVLGDSGRVIRTSDFPHLKNFKGRTLITTDGTTLLGADDKAGIAEIMTAIERIQSENIPHGKISIGFNPDEEIGTGAHNFDVEKFGADFAYTLDGWLEGHIEFENFNASSAIFEIKGINVHPGSAKDIMVNSQLIGMEINSMLPTETPATTEGYEGFYHLMEITGSVENTKLVYIVRDHDADKFDARNEFLKNIEKTMNEKYGEGVVTLTIKQQYRNMKEKIEPCMHLIDNAKKAIRAVGIEPEVGAIRGGTDGAQLSFKGLPCPNIGTGGAAYHGACEHISVEGMDKVVDIAVELVKIYAQM
ncbi:MAG TPA: peptidase T [Terrisporobacter glycolicus]|uniref:Peptidase T n=1 Tax=Terrisporobacter petrolearius TaxID=1460447 RepID=A0ABZ3FIK2_9FIRM|nr:MULTISPECIES: peptidase T [Terrisporobacter]MBN9646751.1 peptidase T [Terrisporobacter glycolicus]UPA29763.1 peptidase T [Terrisporobacter glycolicus]HBI94412.1 peptidase T [Terrisporobacter hibernicus]